MTRRRGMTLIELIVALTIGAIAITAGYAAFATLVDHRAAVDDATRSTMRAYAVRHTLTDWLGSARLDATAPQLAAFRGLSGDRARRPDDELRFLTTARTPLGDGDALVRLYIARDSTGRTLGLAAELTEWMGTRGRIIVLDSTVAGLRIEYQSSMLVSATRWSPSWVSTSLLPAGVRLTMKPAPGDSLPPLLREPVVVVLEGGR